MGLIGMRVGGRRMLTIPSSLAYGSQGTQGIPPNTPLKFDVTLVAIVGK
jgi:FKBP-type peptidyl-prolyl cis-trans isomerase